MSEHSLTTTASQVQESGERDRDFLLSAHEFDGAVSVYVRLQSAGDPDAVLSLQGTSMVRLSLPKGRRLYAWTNAGTAKLVVSKLVLGVNYGVV